MLHLFPHGLESNLLVPVLLGVLVNWALTETLGWDFVGVVVPGYLSAVALVQPVVAVVVVVEAVLTCALARVLDAGATRLGVWYPVFGRDRFYFILVISIFARLGVELAAPVLLGWGAHWLPSLADLRGEMFGIGLVLVPLAANRLWRAGVRSGLFQLGIELGVVRILLAGLVIATNYSLSGFELGFDRLALAFFASPLAQLMLLLTAAIASELNRRFGWDSHGILVPALLALVVTAPIKFAVTLAEAVAIAGIVALVVRAPRVRYANLEGARRLILCLVIGFGIKLATAAVASVHAPGYRVEDLFGFGYLLPSLLAERILTRGNLALVVLPTAQTALVGAPVAAALGLLLVWTSPASTAPLATTSRTSVATLREAVASSSTSLRDSSGHAGGAVLARRLVDGRVDVQTDDAFVIATDAGINALVARPLGLPALREVVITIATDESGVDRAAAIAAQRRSALVVAATPADCEAAVDVLGGRALAIIPVAAAPADVAPLRLETTLRAHFGDGAVPPVSRRAPGEAALDEVAARLLRHRLEPAALAASLQPFGLRVLQAGADVLLVEGDGWPSIVMRTAADGQPVVVAPHEEEVGTVGAALAVREALAADAVVARDERDAPASTRLGVALARQAGASVLLVRGTTFAGGGDVWLSTAPVETGVDSSKWPTWIAAARDLFQPRFSAGRPADEQAASLRAFPAGSLEVRTAIVWLGPHARRVLAGRDALAQADFVELAQRRGVAVDRRGFRAWLAESRGVPSTEVSAEALPLARSGDPSMLSGRLGAARTTLVIDPAHGLAGIGLIADGARAIVLGGDRVEETTSVTSEASLGSALRRGSRVLVARATP